MTDRRRGLYLGIDPLINRCFSDFIGIELTQGDNATARLAPTGKLDSTQKTGLALC